MKCHGPKSQNLLGPDLSELDKKVVAIAADYKIDDDRLPVFELNDVVAIADFVTEHLKVRKAG